MTVDEIDVRLTARLGRQADALHVHSILGRVVELVLGAAVTQVHHRVTSFRAEYFLHRGEPTDLFRDAMTAATDDGLAILMVDVGLPSFERFPVTIEGRVR